MGGHYEWKCDNCGHKVQTDGPLEFYRDAKGHRRPYGHPGPGSKEAEQAGIKGFYAVAYCLHCDSARDALLVEFDSPRDYSGAWSECDDPSELVCPECGGRLSYEDLWGIECPRCRKGCFYCDSFAVS